LKKKILFISPFFGKNGADTVLFNLITHLDREKFDIALVTRHDGPLLPKLGGKVPVFTFNPEELINMKRVNRLVYQLNKRYQSYTWYINTISLPNFVECATYLEIPFFLHIHEMDIYLEQLDQEDISSIIKYPKLIVSCSEATANIFRLLGRKKDIEVCYSNIDSKKIKLHPQKTTKLREELGIRPDDFLWSMSGRDDLNKDPVIFVEFAYEILKQHQGAHFCWIGGLYVSGFSAYARAKAKHLGISDKISWLGFLEDDYYDYLNMADGFVLTSSSESFSLVTLEAMELGKPAITFDSGGVREIISPVNGKVVEDRTPQALAQAALEVMNHREKFNKQEIIESTLRFDISNQIGKWEKLMLDYL
jgi:glycosyltransferase involved in cell wall biosynthesis